MTTNKIKSKKKISDTKKSNEFKEEIIKLKQEIKDKDDKLLRNYAEFQNYQKRMQKELNFKEDELKKKYLLELLDLKELLEKAYEDKDPKEALKLLLKNINNFFEKEEIKLIECMGKSFDHNLHHAVTTIEKDDCEDDIIIEEVKKGYMINEKLLRPSHVIVTKKENKEKNKE
jgi:molecular chaperone GrpE